MHYFRLISNILYLIILKRNLVQDIKYNTYALSRAQKKPKS